MVNWRVVSSHLADTFSLSVQYNVCVYFLTEVACNFTRCKSCRWYLGFNNFRKCTIIGPGFHPWEGKAIYFLQSTLPFANLKVHGKLLKGYQGKDQGNWEHGLCAIPGLHHALSVSSFFLWLQALNYTEALPRGNCLCCPVLDLSAPSKFPRRLLKILMKVPFAKWKWPCPLTDETPGVWLCHNISIKTNWRTQIYIFFPVSQRWAVISVSILVSRFNQAQLVCFGKDW